MDGLRVQAVITEHRARAAEVAEELAALLADVVRCEAKAASLYRRFGGDAAATRKDWTARLDDIARRFESLRDVISVQQRKGAAEEFLLALTYTREWAQFLAQAARTVLEADIPMNTEQRVAVLTACQTAGEFAERLK